MHRDAWHLELRNLEARSPEAAFVELDMRRKDMQPNMNRGFCEALDELRSSRGVLWDDDDD